MKDIDAVNWLLNKAGRFPLLTHEEEIILSRTIQEMLPLRGKHGLTREQKAKVRAGQRAYNRFFTANLRLLIHVAKKYSRLAKWMELSDLIQEGSLGLHRAIELFDSSRGYKFSTYAFWWVRQATLRGLAIGDRSIRLPTNCITALAKLSDWIPEFIEQHGRRPTLDECAAEVNQTKSSVEAYLLHVHRVGSLQVKASEDSSGMHRSTLEELLVDESLTPMERIEESELIDCVNVALDDLMVIEQKLVTKRFGLDGKGERSPHKAYRESGMTPSKAKRYEDRLMNKLRIHFHNAN